MLISPQDIAQLRGAKEILENPSLAAKIANVIGAPFEKGFELLPEKWSKVVADATKKALQVALSLALDTMGNRIGQRSDDLLHKILVVATGAAGGALGLTTLVVELPVSTAIMLRSIADIAQSHGEDLSSINAKLACLEVFALGGRSAKDNASEKGYFAIRAALAKAVSKAAEYIGERGLAKEGGPPLVRLMIQLAERFGIQVSEKVAAQAVPVIGAAGGAVINYIFIEHFQNMARGHFTVRQMERQYGTETVKNVYESSEIKP